MTRVAPPKPDLTADDFLNPPARLCNFARQVADADPDLRATLEAAIAGGANANRIYSVLHRAGLPTLSPNPIRNHLAGRCSCPKP